MQGHGRGRSCHRPIIPSNGNRTGKLWVRVYPRVRSGRVDIIEMGQVWMQVSIIGYGQLGMGGVAEMVVLHTSDL